MAKRILGVLGGQDLDDQMFKSWAAASDILVAADAGADLCLRHGVVPDAIVGDLDSVSEEALGSGAEVYKFDDPNLSDCDKMLLWISEQGHESVTLIGVEGDRLDHVLATLGSCVQTSLFVKIVLRDGLGFVFKTGHHALATHPGLRVSVLPIGLAQSVSVSGVRWPVKDQDMALGGLISLSNEATGLSVEISLTGGAVLVVVESLDILSP